MSLNSEIIIVSGLPRSGTSLMMQMLHRGGIPALTDEIRTADTDNPRGYFEFERVKKTKEDATWLADARGKVVKMVSSLLYDLPATERYRIIFMRRDMNEILESQDKMLERLGRPGAPREKMQSAFSIHLDRLAQWLPTRRDIRVLEVSYNELLSDPANEVNRVATFLDGAPSTTLMLEAIDPSLYRNRRASVES
jgi:Sulfotransferase domain